MTTDSWRKLGGLLGFLAVGLGAFGAHALEPFLVENDVLDTWRTAVLYHLVHGALIITESARAPKKSPAALFFALGILFFSGSLYILCLSGIKILGAVTPIGGVFFLIGWLRLGFLARQDS